MRLPPEILGIVFTMVQGVLVTSPFAIGDRVSSTKERKTIYRPPPSYQWLTILHICESWRNIALNTSYLWNTIILEPRVCPHFDIREFTAGIPSPTAFLDLSGRHQPLNMKIYAPYLSSASAASLLRNLHRVKRLELSGDFNPEEDGIDLLPLSVPNVQVLILHATTVDSNVFRQRTSGQPECNSTVFGGDIQHLQSLSLSSSSMFLALQFQMPKLRQLYLDSLSASTYATVDIAQSLFELLNSIPELEDLIISRSAMPQYTYVRWTRRVYLPKLRRLILNRVSDMGTLLERFELPDTLSMTCVPVDSRPLNISQRHISHSDHFHITRVQLHFQGEYSALRGVGAHSAIRMLPMHTGSSGYPMALKETTAQLTCDIASVMQDHVDELWISADTPSPDQCGVLDSVSGRPKALTCHQQFLSGMFTIATETLKKLYLLAEDDAIQYRCLSALSSSCPALWDLYIRAPGYDNYLVQDLLPQVLWTRLCQGNPIRVLTVHIYGQQHESGTITVDESRWKGMLEHTMRPYVETMKVIVDPGSPRMELVPICQSQSTGIWECPVWGDHPADDFCHSQLLPRT